MKEETHRERIKYAEIKQCVISFSQYCEEVCDETSLIYLYKYDSTVIMNDVGHKNSNIYIDNSALFVNI